MCISHCFGSHNAQHHSQLFLQLFLPIIKIRGSVSLLAALRDQGTPPVAMPLRPSIPVAALLSRAFVVVLCAVCGWGTPYDSSVAEDWNSANPLVASGVDAVTRKALQPLANWDGVYFHHIAYHGYKQEQFHAFFPLMPLLMRCVRYAVQPVLCVHWGEVAR